MNRYLLHKKLWIWYQRKKAAVPHKTAIEHPSLVQKQLFVFLAFQIGLIFKVVWVDE